MDTQQFTDKATYIAHLKEKHGEGFVRVASTMSSLKAYGHLVVALVPDIADPLKAAAMLETSQKLTFAVVVALAEAYGLQGMQKELIEAADRLVDMATDIAKRQHPLAQTAETSTRH